MRKALLFLAILAACLMTPRLEAQNQATTKKTLSERQSSVPSGINPPVSISPTTGRIVRRASDPPTWAAYEAAVASAKTEKKRPREGIRFPSIDDKDPQVALKKSAAQVLENMVFVPLQRLDHFSWLRLDGPFQQPFVEKGRPIKLTGWDGQFEKITGTPERWVAIVRVRANLNGGHTNVSPYMIEKYQYLKGKLSFLGAVPSQVEFFFAPEF